MWWVRLSVSLKIRLEKSSHFRLQGNRWENTGISSPCRDGPFKGWRNVKRGEGRYKLHHQSLNLQQGQTIQNISGKIFKWQDEINVSVLTSHTHHFHWVWWYHINKGNTCYLKLMEFVDQKDCTNAWLWTQIPGYLQEKNKHKTNSSIKIALAKFIQHWMKIKNS